MTVKHVSADLSALTKTEVSQTPAHDLEMRMRAALKKFAGSTATNYDLKAVVSPDPSIVKEYQDFFAERASKEKAYKAEVFSKTQVVHSIFQ
jgi:glycine cleavage system regulatory protein